MKEKFKKYKKAIITVIVMSLMVLAYLGYSQYTAEPEVKPARNSIAVLVEKEKDAYLKDERPFSDLISALSENKVSLMAVTTDGELLVRLRAGARFYVHAPAPAGLLTDTLTKAKDRNVTVVSLRTASVAPPANTYETVVSYARDIGTILFLVILFILVRSQMSGLGGTKNFDIITDSKTKFDDVIGADDAKQALADVVQYLKNPEQFAAIGARAPKGVLMEGPPGTGKTLLAKALAGECGVPFISLDGSSFTSPFVGIGVARVRDLFKTAAKHAPCVVFIDEFDGLGTRENSGGAAGHPTALENSRIINSILTELDGFNTSAGIVVIGATNYASRLDPALLREGRFDRRCTLGMPNVTERAQLFELYSKTVKTAKDIDWKRLSRRSAGLAPSAIAAIVNFGAFIAAQDKREEVTEADLWVALERQQMGSPTASLQNSMTEALRQRVAIHEAGHALVGWKTGMGTLDGVTIVPRARALGVTLLTQEKENLLHTGSELRARIATLLAGRSAELLVLGESSTGASDDLERASSIALAMVSETGLAGPYGPFSFKALGHDSEVFTKGKVMDAAIDLMKELEEATNTILTENRGVLDALTAALLDRETLTGEEARAILENPVLPA